MRASSWLLTDMCKWQERKREREIKEIVGEREKEREIAVLNMNTTRPGPHSNTGPLGLGLQHMNFRDTSIKCIPVLSSCRMIF
jgi:hypothetical protein